jgi:hypothetical protein
MSIEFGHPNAKGAKTRKGRKKAKDKLEIVFGCPFASFAKPLRPLRSDVRLPGCMA